MTINKFTGKTKEEALQLADIFLRMIKGEASDDEILKAYQSLGRICLLYTSDAADD